MNTNELAIAFAMLIEGSKKGSVRKSVVDKVIDERLTRAKTRKGAKHKVNPTFKSVAHLPGVTPAQYRRLHLGKRQGVSANA